jgi:hypothetical protein
MMAGHILTDTNLIVAMIVILAAAAKPVAAWIHSQMFIKMFAKAIQDTTPDQRPPIIIALAQLLAPPLEKSPDEQADDPASERVTTNSRRGLSSIRFLSRFRRDMRDNTSIRG